MIRLVDLRKVYILEGERKVVAERINAIFPTGESVALMGRNGAGKSTLLSIIAGTDDADSGYVESDGTISWPVGFAGSFNKDLSGAQNVRFVARVYGVDTDELVRFVDDFAELGQHFHLPVRSYSSGMKSKLSFGLSMGIKFDTYLVDENTSVGDAAFRAKSAVYFRDRLRQSSAIVVGHGIKMLRKLCTSGAVLEAGHLYYYKNLGEAIEHHEYNMNSNSDDEDDV